MTAFIWRLVCCSALSIFATAATAAPIILTTSNYTDVIGPNATFTAAGTYLHIDTRASSPYLPSEVTAVATYGADSSIVRELFFYSGPIFAEKNFDRIITDLSLTGAWNLTVTDPDGATNGTMPAIADPEFLPLVLNLRVIGNETTPTIAWDLPDLSSFDVDFIRVRASTETGTQIFQSANLSPSATSFLMPGGVLSAGERYEFRVILGDNSTNGLENRSNTFTGLVTITIPEPGTLALLGLGLAGLAASRRRKQ